jgi:hypothetical protein
MEHRHIRGFGKWLLSIRTEADHWLGPGGWVGLIAAGVPPEDRTTLFRELTRKGALNFHEAIINELPELGIGQHRGRMRIKR